MAHESEHKAPAAAPAHKAPAAAPAHTPVHHAPAAPTPPPDPNRPATPAEQAAIDTHGEKVVDAFHKAKADGTPDAAPRTKAAQDKL